MNDVKYGYGRKAELLAYIAKLLLRATILEIRIEVDPVIVSEMPGAGLVEVLPNSEKRIVIRLVDTEEET